MPTYVFEREDTGEFEDMFFMSKDVPKIGDAVVRDGVRWVRRPHFHVDAGVHRKVHQFPRVSESLPRDVDLGCDRDHKGRQIITSTTHEKEVLAHTEKCCGGKYVRD